MSLVGLDGFPGAGNSEQREFKYKMYFQTDINCKARIFASLNHYKVLPGISNKVCASARRESCM